MIEVVFIASDIVLTFVIIVLFIWVRELQNTVDRLIKRDRARGEPEPAGIQGPPVWTPVSRDTGWDTHVKPPGKLPYDPRLSGKV